MALEWGVPYPKAGVMPRRPAAQAAGEQGVRSDPESEGFEEKHRAVIDGATPRMNRSAKDGERSSPHYGGEGVTQATADPYRSISRPKSAVNSIASNCCSSRSRRWKPSETRCSPHKRRLRRRRRLYYLTSRALVRSSPPSSGPKDCSDTSAIAASLLPTQAWRRRPGKADQRARCF